MWVTQREIRHIQFLCQWKLIFLVNKALNWILTHFLSLYQNTSLAQLLSHVAEVEGLSNQVLRWKEVHSSCMLSDRSAWWPSSCWIHIVISCSIIINSVIIMSYIEFCFCNKNLFWKNVFWLPVPRVSVRLWITWVCIIPWLILWMLMTYDLAAFKGLFHVVCFSHWSLSWYLKAELEERLVLHEGLKYIHRFTEASLTVWTNRTNCFGPRCITWWCHDSLTNRSTRVQGCAQILWVLWFYGWADHVLSQDKLQNRRDDIYVTQYNINT